MNAFELSLVILSPYSSLSYLYFLLVFLFMISSWLFAVLLSMYDYYISFIFLSLKISVSGLCSYAHAVYLGINLMCIVGDGYDPGSIM